VSVKLREPSRGTFLDQTVDLEKFCHSTSTLSASFDLEASPVYHSECSFIFVYNVMGVTQFVCENWDFLPRDALQCRVRSCYHMLSVRPSLTLVDHDHRG